MEMSDFSASYVTFTLSGVDDVKNMKILSLENRGKHAEFFSFGSTTTLSFNAIKLQQQQQQQSL